MFPSKFLQFPSILTHFHAANEKIQNGGRDLAISRGLVWVKMTKWLWDCVTFIVGISMMATQCLMWCGLWPKNMSQITLIYLSLHLDSCSHRVNTPGEQTEPQRPLLSSHDMHAWVVTARLHSITSQGASKGWLEARCFWPSIFVV